MKNITEMKLVGKIDLQTHLLYNDANFLNNAQCFLF